MGRGRSRARGYRSWPTGAGIPLSGNWLGYWEIDKLALSDDDPIDEVEPTEGSESLIQAMGERQPLFDADGCDGVGAASFDSNDRLDFNGLAAELDGDFSIFIRAYVPAAGSTEEIVTRNGGLYFERKTWGALAYAPPSTVTSASLDDQTATIAFVADRTANTMAVYVDGVLEDTNTLNDTAGGTTVSLGLAYSSIAGWRVRKFALLGYAAGSDDVDEVHAAWAA